MDCPFVTVIYFVVCGGIYVNLVYICICIEHAILQLYMYYLSLT